MIHARLTGIGPKLLIGVDSLRVREGKLVEHWDVLQEEVLAEIQQVKPDVSDKSINPQIILNHAERCCIKKRKVRA